MRSSAGTWIAASELAVRPSPLGHVEAMTHFARAFGAARSGNPDAAKADIAKLTELPYKLRAAKDAYWAEQVDIQAQVATAWVLFAEGKHADALKKTKPWAPPPMPRTRPRSIPSFRASPRRRASFMARCCSRAAWRRRLSPHSRQR